MRVKIRAVTHDGLCVCYENIRFLTTSSSRMTLYTCDGEVMFLYFKNYRYIKVVPNKEVYNG